MPQQDRLELIRVQYIPKEPKPGILYVAEEFGAAVHLCACGCGSKVSTPLGPTEWTLTEAPGGATLNPSVGNWQLPCQSHYWVREGSILWSDKWSPAQIEAGRSAEEERRRAHFRPLDRKRPGFLQRIGLWIKSLFQ